LNIVYRLVKDYSKLLQTVQIGIMSAKNVLQKIKNLKCYERRELIHYENKGKKTSCKTSFLMFITTLVVEGDTLAPKNHVT